jgi:putative endonuclease
MKRGAFFYSKWRDFKKDKMNNYFVYILLCSDDTYYVGITNDINRRFKEHQKGLDERSYTAQRLPVKLQYVIHFSDVLKAIEYESRIKKWSKAKKKALITGQYISLPSLSKKKFLKNNSVVKEHKVE